MSWKDCLISPDSTILLAIERLDAVAGKTILVAGTDGRLLGTVTDGDIRRGILRSVRLDSLVTTVMNKNPLTARIDDDPNRILSVMRAAVIRQVPLVDAENRVIGLETTEELHRARSPKSNCVVLMAGGLGSRLQPLTDNVPKPLLKVGEQPLLEIILNTLIRSNFRRFYISVNYKADMVKAHFGDGGRWNVDIRYLEEPHRMGTAGALSLIPEKPCEPLLVMNGDLLTNLNFESLLDYHTEHRAEATISVRDYDIEVPFGVVKLDQHRVVGISEKPVNRFFVNAGIYVLSPDCLDLVPHERKSDMTDLIDLLLKRKRPVSAFPIREYWLDVGRPDDFNRANSDVREVFG